MGAEEFVKAHFKGIEKETWYPAIVAIAEGFSSQQNKELIENNDRLKFQLRASDSDNAQLLSKVQELKTMLLEQNTEVLKNVNEVIRLNIELSASKQMNKGLVELLTEIMEGTSVGAMGHLYKNGKGIRQRTAELLSSNNEKQ